MKRFAGPAVVLAASILAASCSRPPGEKKLRIGYVLHGLNDFTAVIQKGAEDAGRDLGVEVEVVGPAGFVATEAIGMFEALVQKRVDGLVVVPQPGEVWVTPIRQATAAGLPVVTANVTSVDSSAAAWFGPPVRRYKAAAIRKPPSRYE